jgi:hypothetical protein
MSDMQQAVAPVAAEEPPLSLFARAVAVFTRPGQAWGGLRQRAQWWFPTVVLVVVSLTSSTLIFQRAIVPMIEDAIDRQVESGQMPAAQSDQVIEMMSGPFGLVMNVVVPVTLFLPLMLILTGLVIWFGAGFVLGTGLKFRLALEVSAWSSLITIPATLIGAAIGYARGTMQGVHVGFGALLPPMEEPTKVGFAIRSFLDWIGPLSIWFVLVAIIGAAVLSGAPRRSVGWVLGGLYLAIGLFVAAMGALFAPGT